MTISLARLNNRLYFSHLTKNPFTKPVDFETRKCKTPGSFLHMSALFTVILTSCLLQFFVVFKILWLLLWSWYNYLLFSHIFSALLIRGRTVQTLRWRHVRALYTKTSQGLAPTLWSGFEKYPVYRTPCTLFLQKEEFTWESCLLHRVTVSVSIGVCSASHAQL